MVPRRSRGSAEFASGCGGDLLGDDTGLEEVLPVPAEDPIVPGEVVPVLAENPIVLRLEVDLPD
jgi:hypothetical protein